MAGGETHHVGGEQRLDELLALRVVRHEPAERQDVGARGGLGREGEPALGHRPGDAGVVERAQQPAQVRTLAPDHDGHLRPRDAVLHVESPQLTRHGGVLL